MDIFPDGRAHASVYVSERNRTIELARRTNLNYTPPSATNWANAVITAGGQYNSQKTTLVGIRLNTNPTPGSTDEVVRVRIQTRVRVGSNPEQFTTLRTWTLDDIPDAGEWMAVATTGVAGLRIYVEVKGAVTLDDVIIAELQD